MDKKLPPQFIGAFKDADIRGIVGLELDDDLAYAIAQAFVKVVKAKTIVVGSDMRISSPSLTEAFITGVRDAGVDVVDIGLCSSPMLYFASGDRDVPGAMITASHSPADFNGLKLVSPGAVPLTNATGLREILHLVQRGYAKRAKIRGRLTRRDVRRAFSTYSLRGFKKMTGAGITVAADAGNGMASLLLPLLEAKLPLSLSSLFTDMDGRFPNRGSDPTLRANQRALAKHLRTGTFDFGIAFDGDADRIAFLDERGRYVNCAVIGALIAEYLLKHKPGSACVFTSLTSRVYEESIIAAGGKAIRAKVGHAFLKEQMRKYQAVFGCEHSGHFFWQDFFYTDSVVHTLMTVLEIYETAKADGKSFSDVVRSYQQYQQLEDVVIEVIDKKQAMQHMEHFIAQEFPAAKVRRFDGLRFEVGNVWGVVKPSVTEHALKIMCEGKEKKVTTDLQNTLVAEVRTIASNSQ